MVKSKLKLFNPSRSKISYYLMQETIYNMGIRQHLETNLLHFNCMAIKQIVNEISIIQLWNQIKLTRESNIN